ncbi:MAG: helix-hairpin-helix domain-containing protein, partial [Candidatus Lokiarchaeota archaeon]|nr:helix-hairpin-helix domain-containing protein [Candidatus Lokiarchaeota archaeon]
MVSVNGTLNLEKKWDLAFLFENLQKILKENHGDQAIEFAENALNEAQTQLNAEWTAKFQEVLNQLIQNRNLYDDPLQVSKSDIQVIQENSEDLTDVKGIGPNIALKLRSAGFNTIQEIANSTPEQIAHIPGIGVATASK